MSGDAMRGVRDALARKRQQITARKVLNADLKRLFARHRSATQSFCDQIAACDDAFERFELEEELLSHQAQFLTEQENIVRRAESAGVWGALADADFLQLVPPGALCAPVMPEAAAPPVQSSDAVANAPNAAAVPPPPPTSVNPSPPLERSIPSARGFKRRFTKAVVAASASIGSVKDAQDVLPEYKKDEPGAPVRRVSTRPKRTVTRKRRLAESDDDDEDAETLGEEAEVDDQTDDSERRDESSDSFVAHSDGDGTNSESEWDDSSAGESSVAKQAEEEQEPEEEESEEEEKEEEQQESEEERAKSNADQVGTRPTRVRVQSAMIGLRDARSCALAGNWAPLEAYYDTKLNSSAVHCGAPLDAKRKKQYKELVTSAKDARLTCSALEWPDFALCRMCNTQKLCRYSIAIAGQNVGSAGGHCAKRLSYIITASAAVADARSQLAAAPKETHESLLRQLTEKVETAYTVLLDHQ